MLCYYLLRGTFALNLFRMATTNLVRSPPLPFSASTIAARPSTGGLHSSTVNEQEEEEKEGRKERYVRREMDKRR